MTDLIGVLANMKRPRLLVRAARHGLQDYDRKRDLRRIAGSAPAKSSTALLAHLVDQEELLETNRKTGCATYSVSKHIEILVALMYESKLLPRGLRAV